MTSDLSLISKAWTPHPGQAEFLTSLHKIKVLACGRRWGKTDCCAAAIVLALQQDSPTKHLIIAPTQDQAALIFDRVLELLDDLNMGKGRALRRTPYPRLKLGAHVVTARSGHLERALRGNEATHIVIDEAAFVPESLITQVALPMLATTNGAISLISTPHGKNHFWRFFQMGVHGENNVWAKRAPSSESPFVSQDFLRIQKGLISERAYAIEYEAEFLDSVDQVFATEAIDDMLVTHLPKSRSDTTVIGIDFARFSDFTAIVVVSGSLSEAYIERIVRLRNTTFSNQMDEICAVVESYNDATVACDSTGMGIPLFEDLTNRLSRTAVVGESFTMPKKAAWIDRLAWLIERRRLKMVPHLDLIRELNNFHAEITDRGIKFRAQQGYTDDIVIALALAVSRLREADCPVLVGRNRAA